MGKKTSRAGGTAQPFLPRTKSMEPCAEIFRSLTMELSTAPMARFSQTPPASKYKDRSAADAPDDSSSLTDSLRD
ncbi:hypothetical protein SAMN02799630_02576 [Paenibacillus sp. UNCCL117]|nr:hypothetical protein SAMN04488602_101245 [Paenibacillus sp. cl123]SFW37834.1 hypothetical protein SAMN02799630_02576 [Paenibacillus sp. UNCCL117]